MSRSTGIDPQTLVRFGLWNWRSVTHIGTVLPAPALVHGREDHAEFIPLCNQERRILWDRRELENSARTAKRPCKACEAKAEALRASASEEPS